MSAEDPFAFAGDASDADIHDFSETLDEETLFSLARYWDGHFPLFAHDGQRTPQGDWRIWMVMGGRGFGKTRAGAEYVRAIAEGDRFARIALVGATLGEARRVMIEGDSGLIQCAPPEQRPEFEPSLNRLTWPNGAQAFVYSAAEPEALRGPQHSHAWCDEIGKWSASQERATRCWDNLLLGLRLGTDPRVVATTTPRNTVLVRRILNGHDTVVSGGGSHANRLNLPPSFLSAMDSEFGQSMLGRQEVGGELLDDIDGALWSRAMLEQCRETGAVPEATRVVVGVDPPATANGDACGIVVCSLGQDGIARVLADCSVARPSPEKWARAVAEAAQAWEADRVVAEANQGGAMVGSVLRAADLALPVKLVHASRGKAARAEPVAALYEAGRVRHCGTFALLEDEMCGLLSGGEYHGPGRSPDRADALVWALTELMLNNRAAPHVRQV